ncbi:cytochrome P450 [Mycena crocata]|nr:cytochrome P450 [Mycena crocata]
MILEYCGSLTLGVDCPGHCVQSMASQGMAKLPTKLPWLTYTEWGLRYGESHIILVNSRQTASELFDKQSQIYSDRPIVPMVALMGWEGNLGFTHYGDKWRQYRRILQQYFRRKSSDIHRPIQIKKIHDLLLGLLSNPDNFLAFVKILAAAIIMETVYGYEIKPTNDHFVTLSENALKKLTQSVLPGSEIVNIFPPLRHLPGWLPGCGFQRIAADTKSMVAKLLQTSKAQGTSDETIQNVAAVAYAVSALGTFFLAMATHPDSQRKAQDEIDAIIGAHRLPTFADRPSLPYVEAIYRETLRWKPVLPLGVAHAASSDDIYEGYFIPKGATVISNIWAMTRDQLIYPEPEVFKPERFLTADGNSTEDTVGFAFGLNNFRFGRRICIVWATIVSILSTFSISKRKMQTGRKLTLIPPLTNGIIWVSLLTCANSHPQPFKCCITPCSETARKLVQATADESLEH